jgi:hypothetical protein
MRLIDSTVTKMANPGKVTVHHELRMYDLFDPIIWPQLHTFGSLRPKKLRPASNRIATPIMRVAETISGGRAFGKITRQIIRESLAPMARWAFTNS